MIRQDQWKLLDQHRRIYYVKFELKNKLLKSICINRKLPLSYRYFSLFKKSLLPKTSSIVKQRNRCIVTGRQWNVLQKTKTSRFVFRSQSYESFLPGVRRDSW